MTTALRAAAVLFISILLGGCVVTMPGPDVAGLPGPNDPGPRPPVPSTQTPPSQTPPRQTPPSVPAPQTPPSGEQVAFDPDAIGPSLAVLDEMASQILRAGATRTGLSGYIVEDPVRSGGVAAISYRGSESVIFVHPEPRRAWSYNTWAFIIGHELSHALQNHQPPAKWQDEHAADAMGADFAHRAGYRPQDYVAFICTQPDVCSPSHGCFHDRMRKLEAQFAMRACGLDPAAHAGHMSADGAVPVPPGVEASDRSCVHEGEACTHGGPQCEITAPVREVIPCRHLMETDDGLVPIHPDGDIVYDMRSVPSPVCLMGH